MKFYISSSENIKGFDVTTVVVDDVIKLYCVNDFENKKYFSHKLFDKYQEEKHNYVFEENNFDEKYEKYEEIFFKYFEEHCCFIVEIASSRFIPKRILEDYIDWSIEYMNPKPCIE